MSITVNGAFAELLSQLAVCLGVPKCNSYAQSRENEDGSRMVATDNGNIIISANSSPSGYIRKDSQLGVEPLRGCGTSKYYANFVAVLWQQGGNVKTMEDAAIYNFTGCSFAPSANYSSVDAQLMTVGTVYEQIIREESAPKVIPTQAGLAVIKIEFTLSYKLPDCNLGAPSCGTPAPPPAPPLPAFLQKFLDSTLIDDPTIVAAMAKFSGKIVNSTWGVKLLDGGIFYPYVGGSSFEHKFNLINAEDADVAYRISWNGGYGHDGFGIQPNGINAWANTHYNESIHGIVGQGTFFFYSRTQTGSVQTCDMGAFDGVRSSNIFPRVTIINPDRLYLRLQSAGAGFVPSQTNTTRTYIWTRDNPADVRALVNSSSLLVQTEASNGLPTVNTYLNCLNASNSPQFYSSRAMGCQGLCRHSLTNAEMIDMGAAIDELMLDLGRNV